MVWNLSGAESPATTALFVVVALPAGPAVTVQRVEDVTPARTASTWDLGRRTVRRRSQRLVEARARPWSPSTVLEGEFTWTVLADPDGNQFCVAAAD